MLSNPLPTPLPDPDAPPTPAPGTNSDDSNAYVEKLFCNWVKNSHLAFLNDHLSTYHERINQGKSQANDYVHEVVKDYFKRYHWKLKVSDEPSENDPLQMESDESLSPVELKQKSQKIIAMQKQAGEQRMDSASQPTFWHLTKQTEGLASTPAMKWRSAGLPSKKMAAFHDKITRKHFKKLLKEEQTDWKDKVQAKGKAAVQEWKDWLEAAPSTSPIDRPVALDNLASFAGPILAGMSATLGMHISLLVGGPEPRKQGKITVVSMHEGVDSGPIPCNWQTQDQKKFKMVTKYFQEYLLQAYTKQDCDSCCLPDDLDNMFTILQAGDQSDTEEDQTGGEMNKPTAAKFRSHRAKPRQQGTKPGRASRQKPSKPSEMDESSSESSSLTSGSSSSSSSSALSISTDSEGETHQELPFTPKKMNYGVAHFNSHHKEAALRQLNTRGSHLVPNGNHFTSKVSDQTSEVPDRASTVPDRSSEAAVFEMLEDTKEFDELAKNTNTPVNEVKITIDRPPVPPAITSATVIESPVHNITAPPPFADNVIDPCLRGLSGVAVNHPPALLAGQDLHEPVNDHDMGEIFSAEQDTEGATDDHDMPHTNLDERTGNSNQTATSPDSNLSLNLPALLLSPLWFRNPFQQLMNPAPASPRLIQLFEKLVCLKDASSFANEKAALGCKHRPIEVHWWISRGCKGKPTIPDLDAFISQWWSWWLMLQLEWRKFLPHTDDGNWDTLNKPGANGMLSIVAILKWWADGANGKGHKESCWEDAADDMTWVLDRLTAIRSMLKSKSSGGNKKWGHSDTQARNRVT
ncbi:hypothetical protein BDR06DRAFT_1013638 [Suillus hirtellus]|nr:hypothetical protein BDR06DRAFT_1013638 [Suillus hirtellus]